MFQRVPVRVPACVPVRVPACTRTCSSVYPYVFQHVYRTCSSVNPYVFQRVYPYVFQCVPLPGMGFRRGGYRCVCADGYYFPNPNASADYFSGADVESAYIRALLNGSRDAPLACLPCSKGCRTCVNGSRCVAEYDVIMRGVPLGIQSFCMTIAALMGFIVVRLRKTKVSQRPITSG